jgi:hypothetical protein
LHWPASAKGESCCIISHRFPDRPKVGQAFTSFNSNRRRTDGRTDPLDVCCCCRVWESCQVDVAYNFSGLPTLFSQESWATNSFFFLYLFLSLASLSVSEK